VLVLPCRFQQALWVLLLLPVLPLVSLLVTR
jgi:hypothetical protein